MDTAKLMSLMKQKKAALKQKTKTLKPNPGSNRYILLPGWRKGEEHIWQHEFGQHFIKDATGAIQAVYPCVDATYGRPCPICEGIGKAMRMTSDDDTMKQLEDAACGAKKQKFLVNVLALDSDDPKTPQILEVGRQVYVQMIEIVEEWAAGVFDEESPQIIIVSREGKGLTTKYSVQVSSKRSVMPPEALSKLNNLDEYVLQENEENQKRALNAINNVAGLLPASSEDRPKTTRSLDDEQEEGLRAAERATKKAAAADPELDDELDDLLADMTGTDD
jgi:hypothetical protein